MNVYQVEGYSNCGTYFQPYLNFVIVIANSKEEAKQIALDTYEGDWVTEVTVEELYELSEEPVCIYSHYQADY